MHDKVQMLDGLVTVAIAEDRAPTMDSIRARIAEFRGLPGFSEIGDQEAEALARELEQRIGVSMGIGSMVVDQEFLPWLHDAKGKGLITQYYWPRYQQLLQSKGLPPDVVTKTDGVTDRILDHMGNPRETGHWDRRGMVMGHVQSGKTANYTGLICKAADAGYRFIVVIAGIHNNLRNQTQSRIDEGFIGRDTGRLQALGFVKK